MVSKGSIKFECEKLEDFELLQAIIKAWKIVSKGKTDFKFE